MAVWMIIYGRNKLAAGGEVQPGRYIDQLNSIPLDGTKILDSIAEVSGNINGVTEFYQNHSKGYLQAMSEKEYKSYLDSMRLPYMPVNELIDHFITEAHDRYNEGQRSFIRAYELWRSGQKSDWKLNESGNLENDLFYPATTPALRIFFQNDLIALSDSFAVFSNYSNFLKEISIQSRDYYHQYFKEVLKLFKSDFILYAHEWSGIDYEEDDFNAAILLEQSDWRNNTSDSLHTMDRYYYEALV